MRKKKDSSFFEKKEAKKLLFLRCFGIGALFVASLLGLPSIAAERVVSLNLCTDQLLVLLAPGKITALTTLSRDASLSFVAAQATHLPVVRADAEAVLDLHPDLVLAGDYGAQATVALLKQRVRVEQFAEPVDFAGIAATLRRMGRVLDAPDRAEALITHMEERLAALPHAARGRAIFWQAGGWTAGPGTLADAALRAAGWQDAGRGGRMGLEALLRDKPDLLVTDTAPAFPSLNTDMIDHPALRGLRRRSVDPSWLTCGGPFSVQAAELLAH